MRPAFKKQLVDSPREEEPLTHKAEQWRPPLLLDVKTCIPLTLYSMSEQSHGRTGVRFLHLHLDTGNGAAHGKSVLPGED